MGIIEVEATAATGSTCRDRLCVTLEDRPICRSVTRPAYITNPPHYDEKFIYVCLGDSLMFIDNSISTTSPIVGYYWHSPWGTSTNTTYAFVARAMGTHTVEHRVYNECGCYDVEYITLIVGASCPLELSCYGTVCANNSVDYSVISPTCTNYNWDVEGGVLVLGQGTPHVSVVWGEPESGYGILTLDGAQCACGCQSPKSIKVPVISDAVSIAGAEVVCSDQTAVYSLPLWGGTAYSWSVTPTTGVYISSGDSTNELVVQFSANGTYTISVVYKCDFLGCGPYTASKTIYVKDELSITSPQSDIVCIGDPVEFATNATTVSRWSITKGGESEFESTAPTTTLTYTFTAAGVYTVTAENDDYCSRATKVVEVPDKPRKFDAADIDGPREVCPGYAQYYSATPDGPDYFVEWTWDNGVFNPVTYTGNQVIITFGNPVGNISVRQVDRRTGCKSDACLIEITPFSFDPWPYAGSLIKVCQGQTFELDRMQPHEATVLYEWTVAPTYAATVLGDHLKPNVTVLANYSNNLPETVAMVLKRKACGRERYDTAWVYIGEIEPPVIDSQIVYCAHVEDVLRMTADSDWENADSTNSYWVIRDGNGDSIDRVDGLPGFMEFPSAGTYEVVLHYVAKQGCTAICSTHVQVISFPAFHFLNNGTMLCVVGGDPNETYNYVWSTGAVADRITIPTSAVTCFVCDANNICCTTMRWAPVSHGDCVPVAGAFTATPKCYNIMEISINTSFVPLPVTLQFLCGTTEMGSTRLEYPTQRVLVPQHCVDGLLIKWQDNGVTYCGRMEITPVTGDLLDFDLTSNCSGHIVVTDNTQYTGSVPLRVAAAALLSGGPETQVAFPPNGMVARVHVLGSITGPTKFRVRVYVGNDPECYAEYVEEFDPLPSIVSVDFPDPMCQYTPATFSAVATGCRLEYEWNFGDISYNFGNPIQHSYDHGQVTPTLTVRDCHGCSVSMDANSPIEVKPNPITNREIAGRAPACYGDEMRLVYHERQNMLLYPGGTYLWTPGDYTTAIATVYAGGDYVVQESIVTLGCRGETEGNAKYPNEIIAQIRCQESYCEGDEVTALGYAGEQYGYAWKLYDQYNTEAGSSTEANYTFTPPAAGNYRLELTVSENGCSESCTAQFTVHPRPTAPSIVFGANACIGQGPVQLVSVGNTPLLWNNGDNGVTATYYTAGPVQAYYVDNYGCQSYPATTVIPFLPNFDGLLTGCYGICPDDKPYLTVYTLGNVVGKLWKWKWNGNTMDGGAVPLPPLTITLPTYGPGDYQMEVFYTSDGCIAESPILTLNRLNCDNAGGGPGAGTTAHVLTCNPTIKSCEADGCMVEYSAYVTVCNRSTKPVTVASMSNSAGLSVTMTTTLPQTLLPDECMTIYFSFTYDFTTPAAVLFSVFDMSSTELGRFALNLADCIECLKPDECDFTIAWKWNLIIPYSDINQVVYYDLDFFPTSPNAQILAVWCDGAGEIVSGWGGNPYHSRFSISYGQLTQLMESGEPLCFYVLCCVEDKSPCLHQICLTSEDIEDLYHVIIQALTKYNERDGGEAYGDGEQQRYRLVPNPTMGKVCVVEESTGVMATDVNEVEVLSLAGQTLLHHSGGGWIDLSSLPTGSYMVRIYGAREKTTQKLVIKRP